MKIDKKILSQFLYFRRVPYNGKFVASSIFLLLFFGGLALCFLWLLLGINALWVISALIFTFAIVSIALLERESRPKWCEFATEGFSVILLAIFWWILCYIALVMLFGRHHILFIIILIVPIFVFILLYIKYLKKKLVAGETIHKMWPTPLKMTVAPFLAGNIGMLIARTAPSSFFLFGVILILTYMLVLLSVPYLSMLLYKAYLCHKYL